MLKKIYLCHNEINNIISDRADFTIKEILLEMTYNQPIMTKN